MTSTPDTGLFRHDPNIKQFAAGAVIFREGEVGDVMYVIQDGEVELAIDGLTVEVVGPEGIFGEMAVVDDMPRSATATASTAVTVVPLDQRRIMAVFTQNPFFAIQIMRTLSRRLRHVDAEIISTHGA